MREKECISYVVKDDCGYAPNPWWGECTLAVCKPVIRKTAREGDLIIGLTPIALEHRLVYAMFVEEIISLSEYYQDPRFKSKKPDFQSDDVRMWMGDNFYQLLDDEYTQHLSAHNIEGRDKETLDQKMAADLSGMSVLISNLFFYYGKNSPLLSSNLDFLRVGRGHRLTGTKGVLAFERYASKLIKTPGIHGNPRTLEREAAKLKHLHI